MGDGSLVGTGVLFELQLSELDVFNIRYFFECSSSAVNRILIGKFRWAALSSPEIFY